MYEDATGKRGAIAERRRGCLSAWLVSFVGLLSAFPTSGQNEPIQPGFEVLRTGSNVPLASVSRSFEISTNNTAARLDFTFGFGSDETIAPGVFFDSFSVALAGQEQGESALLVTLDASGPHWAPPNPGGLPVNEAVISRNELLFDRGRGDFAVTHAYSVSLPIPDELGGGLASLLFDLFDNLNAAESVAYFGEITLNTAPTNRPGRHGLMSATTPLGPYAFETDYETNSAERTISFPRVARMRFYQFDSEGACRFLPVVIEGGDFVFRYEFLAPSVSLEKNSDLARPWVTVSNAVVSLAEKTVSAPWDPTARFYRLVGNLRTRILFFELRENTLLMGFDFQPARVVLKSSAQPDGPYAVEQGARYESVGQAVRIPRNGGMRFFRFSTDDPRDLVDVRLVGDRIVCGYRLREPGETNSTQGSNGSP